MVLVLLGLGGWGASEREGAIGERARAGAGGGISTQTSTHQVELDVVERLALRQVVVVDRREHAADLVAAHDRLCGGVEVRGGGW